MKREEFFKDYLRNWDFDVFPLMPIAKADAEILIRIFDQRDRDAAKKAEWYQEHRDERLTAANTYNKSKAFIKKEAHSDIWK